MTPSLEMAPAKASPATRRLAIPRRKPALHLQTTGLFIVNSKSIIIIIVIIIIIIIIIISIITIIIAHHHKQLNQILKW